jgi:hypothetical protein
MVAVCVVGTERDSITMVCCTAGSIPTARILRNAPRQTRRLSDLILVNLQRYKKHDVPALESPE